jgi:hypothetical protein
MELFETRLSDQNNAFCALNHFMRIEFHFKECNCLDQFGFCTLNIGEIEVGFESEVDLTKSDGIRDGREN